MYGSEKVNVQSQQKQHFSGKQLLALCGRTPYRIRKSVNRLFMATDFAARASMR